VYLTKKITSGENITQQHHSGHLSRKIKFMTPANQNLRLIFG